MAMRASLSALAASTCCMCRHTGHVVQTSFGRAAETMAAGAGASMRVNAPLMSRFTAPRFQEIPDDLSPQITPAVQAYHL